MKMEQEATNHQQKLTTSILEAGKRAFDPSASPTERQDDLESFEELINGNGVWDLLPVLNALIKPNVVPDWLKVELMTVLTKIPLRPGGVRGTLEFVFSVHPSSSSRPRNEDAAPQKQGSHITQEALAVATRILTSPPVAISPETWFNTIAPQLFHLVDGVDGWELSKAAAQVIVFGVLGGKRYGAPGSPGWNAFVVPVLSSVDPSLSMTEEKEADVHDTDDLIDLTRDRVLVSTDRLHQALVRLTTLLNSTPYPAQTRRILSPILVHLWAIASWLEPTPHCEEAFCKPARSLLQTFFKIATTSAKLLQLTGKLLYSGEKLDEARSWRYRTSSRGDMDIIVSPMAENSISFDMNWNEVQTKSNAFVSLVVASCTPDEISAFFLELLGRWLVSTNQSANPVIGIRPVERGTGGAFDETTSLLEVSVLHKMLERAPEKLISRIEQVLELVCRILDPTTLRDQNDDVLSVALSLLHLVITSPTFQKTNLKQRGLEVLETGLRSLSEGDRPEISQTARNLSMILQYQDAVDEMEEKSNAFLPTNQQVEDRNTYKLAISYITQADNPPPVRSEGLNLISKLVIANSTVLDVQAVLILLSSLLQDGEDFINIRVISLFARLANKHPLATLKEILDHYLDAKETATTDTRLRFGEALLQVIERMGETFAGEAAQLVTETLLSIAGRRGHRPKTEAKQAREARLQERRHREATDAWGGDVPDLAEDMAEDEQARNDILTQIVQGWESNRGSEDVRIRSSALSILSGAIDTNITGLGPELVSTSVDLSVNVLTLEPDLEKGIVRRAAIIFILSFVTALDDAKKSGRKIGFGLTDQSREDILRVLKYVAVTDNDGLVQQHARDVIESLEAWQAMSLLPPEGQQSGPSLNTLAGISIGNENTNSSIPNIQSTRPRIEEIE